MKSKFTEAKSITKETKQKVWERQNGKSIFTGRAITIDQCCCHFVGRGCSGVGFEFNIFGATPEEHRLYDESKPIGNLTHEECEIIIKNHFKINYIGWDEKKCKYKKGKGINEYGIGRRISKI